MQSGIKTVIVILHGKVEELWITMEGCVWVCLGSSFKGGLTMMKVCGQNLPMDCGPGLKTKKKVSWALGLIFLCFLSANEMKLPTVASVLDCHSGSQRKTSFFIYFCQVFSHIKKKNNTLRTLFNIYPFVHHKKLLLIIHTGIYDHIATYIHKYGSISHIYMHVHAHTHAYIFALKLYNCEKQVM